MAWFPPIKFKSRIPYMFYDSAAQIFPALLAVLGGGGEDRGGLKSARARLQLLLIHLAEA